MKNENVNIPENLREKSQAGLILLKEAIMALIEANPNGIKNSQIAQSLNLQSDQGGKQKDYLTYSILGLLMAEKKVLKGDDGRYKMMM